jgi:hypothetical protein
VTSQVNRSPRMEIRKPSNQFYQDNQCKRSRYFWHAMGTAFRLFDQGSTVQ